jgi:hypothetical protein
MLVALTRASAVFTIPNLAPPSSAGLFIGSRQEPFLNSPIFRFLERRTDHEALVT